MLPVAPDAAIWPVVPLILVGRGVHDSEAPNASTPMGKFPAAQFAPLDAREVEVVEFPLTFAVIVPALKFPDESRASIEDTVLELTAVVLEFGRTPPTSTDRSTGKQPSAAPVASIPRGSNPLAQFAGFADKLLAVKTGPTIFAPLREVIQVGFA